MGGGSRDEAKNSGRQDTNLMAWKMRSTMILQAGVQRTHGVRGARGEALSAVDSRKDGQEKGR